MIKSYKCTKSIREKHYTYLKPICYERLDAFREIFSIIAHGIINPSVIRCKLAPHTKVSLRTAGSVILANFNYKNLGFDELVNELSKRVNIIKSYIVNSNSILELLKFVKKEKILKSILVGKPRLLELVLYKLTCKFPSLIKSNELFIDEVGSIFSKVFNYDSFKRGKTWSSHKLQLELGTKYCLYCNLIALPNKGYSFDHCIPQATYPLFAISLLNLIPSCTTCNTNNKKEIPFFTYTHIHPYYKDYLENYSFYIDFKSNVLNIRTSKKSYAIHYKCRDANISQLLDDSFKDLDLLSEYDYHKNEIDKYLEIIYFYDITYIKSVINFINGRGGQITVEILYNYLFNRELSFEKFCCNSYSRLIYDLCYNNGIMEKLKIVTTDV